MLRIVSTLAMLGALSGILVGGSPASSGKGPHPFPEVIQLPTGFRPEGIEVGRGTTFYVGSVANGAIYRGNLRTGSGAIFIPGAAGKAATGIELDSRKRLFVAGAATGNAYVYDAKTGALLRTYNLGTPPTFINDVVVTHNAAYFTDSQKNVFYRVPIGPGGALRDAQTITLGGDYAHVAGRRSSRFRRSTAACTGSIPQAASRGRFRSSAGRAFRTATGSCLRARGSTSSRTS
jgi:hypothetical protein